MYRDQFKIIHPNENESTIQCFRFFDTDNDGQQVINASGVQITVPSIQTVVNVI